jgi:hypothetical protein
MTATALPVRLAALVALLGASAAAQATITTFTNQASFVALTSATVDGFADLTINTALGATSLARTGYSVTTETDLYVVPVASAIALSTGNFSDTLTLGSFSSPLLAVGGNFYGTNILGEVAGGALTVVATDINGLTRSVSVTGGSASGFLGFVSDVPLVSVVVGMSVANTDRFASLDNVSISAVPEASTWLLMLAGGAAVLRAASRRGRA